MENSKFWTMLEQYAQEGKDARTLLEDCTALAAAGKTPLGLNQWVKSDKPLMEDFNEDNRIIDEKLRELAEIKTTGRWTIFGSLEEIGLVAGSETAAQIHAALPDHSMLVCGIYGAVPAMYPPVHGILSVVKESSARTKWEYFQNDGAQGTGGYWIGSSFSALDDAPAKWSGWQSIATSTVRTEPFTAFLPGFSAAGADWESSCSVSPLGQVTLAIAVQAASGFAAGMQKVGTVAVRCRPSHAIPFLAVSISGGVPMLGEISSNGDIRLYIPSTPAIARVGFTVSYYAALP